jgi:hypothetical protein
MTKTIRASVVNWQTSMAGLLAAIGATLEQNSNPTLHLIGTILLAVGTFLTGLFARTATKTDEQSLGKKTLPEHK